MTGTPIHMGYLCNRLLYTQAGVSIEVICVGWLLARLCKGYKLEAKLMRERSVGTMTPLDEAEILHHGIPRMVMPEDEEDMDEPPPPPPTFPLVPPPYAAVRGWGDMQAFQYLLHLESLQCTEELHHESLQRIEELQRVSMIFG